MSTAGVSFIVVDASPQTVLALADSLKGKRVLILNAGSSDDRLRETRLPAEYRAHGAITRHAH